MADTLFNDYRQKAHVIGDTIISWARPEGWPEGPTSVLQILLQDIFDNYCGTFF